MRMAALACMVLAATVACGVSTDNQATLRQQAAQSFEALDTSYLNAQTQALLTMGSSLPHGFELGTFSLAVSSHSFAQALKTITMPDDSKTDAATLTAAAQAVDQDAIALYSIEETNPGGANADALTADLGKRNDADRRLRKDLNLDQKEVPS